LHHQAKHVGKRRFADAALAEGDGVAPPLIDRVLER
jgi:hypothetical protein